MRYLIEYFTRFRKFVGSKVYFLLCLMLVVGFVEGIGVTLFLPVLQEGFGDDKLSHILKSVFNLLHIGYSFTVLLALILGFFILRAVFLILYAKYFGRIIYNLIVTLRRNILDRVFKVDYLYFLKKEIGYVNNVFSREIPAVVEAFSAFSQVLSHAIYALMYIALSLLLNPKITAIALILSLILSIFMRKLNLLINQASLDLSFARGKFQSIMIQALSKIKYLTATLAHSKVSRIIGRENKNLGSSRYKLFFFQALSKSAFEPFVVLFVVGLFFYYVVILNQNVNAVMFLIFLFLQVARQFLNAQSSYRKFLASRGSIETYNNFLLELEENKKDLNLQGVSPDFDRDIIFRDVTVIFPNGKKALDNVNITIRPKSAVAFVGHSGSGKSTIANMITGLVRPTRGEILFGSGGYDKLNLKTLRENIGYVTQEDVIFNASIKENISLWDGGDADEARLNRAIEMAHITGFVNDLPERQNSMLGDNGLDMSGGQRQRITIARELYKEVKLLILDEATSSLDSKAENQIYENLREFKGTKTMVVIAHRLSTIKNADYVYVLDEGRVVEEGTYEELHQNRGEFTKMIEAQKLT